MVDGASSLGSKNQLQESLPLLPLSLDDGVSLSGQVGAIIVGWGEDTITDLDVFVVSVVGVLE